jgi:hypothetical protein
LVPADDTASEAAGRNGDTGERQDCKGGNADGTKVTTPIAKVTTPIDPLRLIPDSARRTRSSARRRLDFSDRKLLQLSSFKGKPELTDENVSETAGNGNRDLDGVAGRGGKAKKVLNFEGVCNYPGVDFTLV